MSKNWKTCPWFADSYKARRAVISGLGELIGRMLELDLGKLEEERRSVSLRQPYGIGLNWCQPFSNAS